MIIEIIAFLRDIIYVPIMCYHIILLYKFLLDIIKLLIKHIKPTIYICHSILHNSIVFLVLNKTDYLSTHWEN